MNSFRIIAQSFTSNQRIANTIQANSEAAAIRSVSATLEAAGFYVVDVKKT